MTMEIKIELLRLGKKQIDLCKELNRRGISCCSSDLSYALNNVPRPKYDQLRTESEKVINDWKEKAYD
jgi:hypothetical protein